MMIKILSQSEIQNNLKRQSEKIKSIYYGIYSSWHGGLITDKDFMMIPIDDHLVHRGDGVFEAIKIVNQKPYLLRPHLDRLLISAQFLKLPLPFPLEWMLKAIPSCIEQLNLPALAMLRIFVSRGPGDFSVSPKSTVGSQLYMVFTDAGSISEEKRVQGFKIGFAKTPAKDPWMAPYKTCNYIQNVFLKGEALDQGWDFAIAHHNGIITESATENLFWLAQDGVIEYPPNSTILTGTVMARAIQLASEKLNITSRKRSITIEELVSQKEVMMAGTTLDVLPVTEIKDHSFKAVPWSSSIAKKLNELIQLDQHG